MCQCDKECDYSFELIMREREGKDGRDEREKRKGKTHSPPSPLVSTDNVSFSTFSHRSSHSSQCSFEGRNLSPTRSFSHQQHHMQFNYHYVIYHGHLSSFSSVFLLFLFLYHLDISLRMVPSLHSIELPQSLQVIHSPYPFVLSSQLSPPITVIGLLRTWLGDGMVDIGEVVYRGTEV